MRDRILRLIRTETGQLWIGTFHGIALRLLRTHAKSVGFENGFTIIDANDQKRLFRQILKSDKYKSADIQVNELAGFINNCKEEGQRARHSMSWSNHPSNSIFPELYQEYEKLCNRDNLVDFGEMLLRTLELLQDNKDVRLRYHRQFKHILVDEFQDTNAIQYAWLRTLAGPETNVMVVGDDDQSIYSFRGAVIENLWRFKDSFDRVTRYTLERNYRSTRTILDAANSLISNNYDRLGKKLWTEKTSADKIVIHEAADEVQEAAYVPFAIQRWKSRDKQRKFDDVAILYRTNAQSNVLEQALTNEGMPYRIRGNIRFYAREEIQNALAYMRLMLNPHDNIGFTRVYNVPARGIGAKTFARIENRANFKNLSLWDAMRSVIADPGTPRRERTALVSFADLIDSMAKLCQGKSLSDVAHVCVRKSGLIDMYEKLQSEVGKSKVENLGELVSECDRFNPEQATLNVLIGETDAGAEAKDRSRALLELFLERTVLDAGEYEGENGDKVTLMTLHAAKGLEYPFVIITGMEQGLVPHPMGELAEERRLAFVGMTRAMDVLQLTFADSRTQFGRSQLSAASKFLTELPEDSFVYSEESIERIGQDGSQNDTNSSWSEATKRRSYTTRSPATDRWAEPTQKNLSVPFEVGTAVKHARFGSGIVLSYERGGKFVSVRFEDGGTKLLLADTPRLVAED